MEWVALRAIVKVRVDALREIDRRSDLRRRASSIHWRHTLHHVVRDVMIVLLALVLKLALYFRLECLNMLLYSDLDLRVNNRVDLLAHVVGNLLVQ